MSEPSSAANDDIEQQNGGGPTSSSFSTLPDQKSPTIPLHETFTFNGSTSSSRTHTQPDDENLVDNDDYDDDDSDNLDDLPIADATPEGIIAHADLVLLTPTRVVPLTQDQTTGKTIVRPPDYGHLDDLYTNKVNGGVGQRPSLISVHFFKQTMDSSIGLTFQSVNGILTISGINPKKPIALSNIRRGDEVIGLDNNRHCSRWTALEAVNFIRSKQPGYLALLLRNPSGDPNLHEAILYLITYSYSDIPDPGIEFQNDSTGRLRIKNLSPFGTMGSQLSALNVGDFVETINGTACTHLNADVAKQVMMDSAGIISIIAKHTDSTEISLKDLGHHQSMASEAPSVTLADGVVACESLAPADFGVPMIASVSAAFGARMDLGTMEYLEEEGIQPRFIYVKCHKPTVDALLGIEFSENSGSALKIDKINRSGILGSSPLKEGYDVLAIDGKVCTTWTKSEATDYLMRRHSDIVIVARNFAGTSSYVVAQAAKPTPRSKAGLTFRKYSNGPLTIGQVNPTGIFAGSILNEKDDVLSINGIPARSLSTSDACAIIEDATDTVTVVARTNSNTGIVLAKLGPGESHVSMPSLHLESDVRSGKTPVILSFICCVVVLFFILVIATAPEEV